MRRQSPFLHSLVGAVAISITTAGVAVWLIGLAALESPNARILCTAQGLLREREPREISCEGPSVHVPARFRVTPLWGDPNPQLLAVSITGGRIPYGGPLINRYMVVPLGWNIVSPFQYGTGPIESLYFRVEHPNPSW